jgi:hypothetical protein
MKKTIFTLLLVYLMAPSIYGQGRDVLLRKANELKLEQILFKDFSDIQFPAYKNRDFWNGIPSNLKQEYIRRAEDALKFHWPVVLATDYLEIIRSGDRRQEAYAPPRSALTALVMGELVEGKGRFIDQIINGVWYYSEQTWWGWSAHLTLQKAPHGLPDADEPTIDLGVGEIANILSWTWYLFREEFDRVHPLIARRLKNEIMKKAVIPYYERDDFWWMGLSGSRSVNNWNPWTNHNILTAMLILEDDPIQRTKGVQKVIRSLDAFINVYPDDGGCDEGPSYWGRAGASLYQCLDLLKRATGGRFDVYDNPVVRNMGNYIYKAYIEYPYFINFADADATTGSRPEIIYHYGKDINDPIMQKFGAFLAKKQDWKQRTPGGKIDEQIMQLMYLDEIDAATAENALIAEFWLPQTEIAGARDQQGSSRGFFFAAKGGFNAESHNHNDAGSSVMYYNGKPCLIDLGREQYTAHTFSSRRYEIWTMQSKYHNLPVINGADQQAGREFKAKNTEFTVNRTRAVFKTDIAGAYPEDAKIKSWVRSYTLDRGKNFIIADQYEFTENKGKSSSNLITYCKVSEVSPGMLKFEGDGFSLDMFYNHKILRPKIVFIEVTDPALKRYWPNGVTHVVMELIDPRSKGSHELRFSPSKT